MRLLHNNVLVQLDPKPEDTFSAGGIFLPDTTVMETDGGSLRSTIDENAKWLVTGTVINASTKALKEYEEEGLKIGSKVRLMKVATTPNHYFFHVGSTSHQGEVLVNVALIEAILD